MVPAYLRHMRECKDSMIVRILGAYSIKMHSQSIHFICMANVFRGPYTQHLEVYDLKGSWVGRSTAADASGRRGDTQGKTMKDTQ